MRATPLFLFASLTAFAIIDSAVGAEPPYDEYSVEFRPRWCAPPAGGHALSSDVFDQSSIKEICAGAVNLEEDLLIPGAKVTFTNDKVLTIGCLADWTELGGGIIARDCVNASGEPKRIMLYEQLAAGDRTVVAIWALIPNGPHIFAKKPKSE